MIILDDSWSGMYPFVNVDIFSGYFFMLSILFMLSFRLKAPKLGFRY